MNTDTLQWNATRAEMEQIRRIAKRASALARQYQTEYTVMDAFMDVEACHCNGMPLDLAKLEAADDFNFTHDVFGISRHINRRTGKLENCFVPRCAAR